MALAQKVIGTGLTGATAAGSAMAIVAAAVDAHLITRPAASALGTITFAAVPGKRYQLVNARFVLEQIGAVAAGIGTYIIGDPVGGAFSVVFITTRYAVI